MQQTGAKSHNIALEKSPLLDLKWAIEQNNSSPEHGQNTVSYQLTIHSDNSHKGLSAIKESENEENSHRLDCSYQKPKRSDLIDKLHNLGYVNQPDYDFNPNSSN